MILRGDKFVQVRFTPEKKANRITLSVNDSRSLYDWFISSKPTSDKNIQRRQSARNSIRLEHRFWEIGQDPYVKQAREKTV